MKTNSITKCPLHMHTHMHTNTNKHSCIHIHRHFWLYSSILTNFQPHHSYPLPCPSLHITCWQGLVIRCPSQQPNVDQISNLIKTTYSYFPSYHSDHNKILHIPRQLCCLGMSKISLWWVNFSINYTNDNFLKVGIGSKFHKWDWRKVWCHCMQSTVNTMLNSCN